MNISHYRQGTLFEDEPALMLSKKEDQWFDRKSGRIAAGALANDLVGFANADGGTIVVGVEDGEFRGIPGGESQINSLRQAAIDFTVPHVRHTVEVRQIAGSLGQVVSVMVFEVHPSELVHRNQKDDVYLRVGDETRRLSADAARELEYDKGIVQFDGSPVSNATFSDLDTVLIDQFKNEVAATGDGTTLLSARGLILQRSGVTTLTPAAILLFGREPQRFFPNAYVRLVKYEGTFPKTGTRLNVAMDRRFEGTLLSQLSAARAMIAALMPEQTVLDGNTGRFKTEPMLPQFAWFEAIVNAVTHRSYSLHGDHIRIKWFDDRMEVESPGSLPGPVRIDNIRHTRFSRNPRIARVLADHGFVRELNEGMNRMFQEMEFAGLPSPFLELGNGVFRVALQTAVDLREWEKLVLEQVPSSMFEVLQSLISGGSVTSTQASLLTGLSLPTTRRHLQQLERAGLLQRVSTSPNDPKSHWRIPLDVRRIG